MHIERLRRAADSEIIDYQTLMGLLSHYSRPRDKISAWLKKGDLVQIKRGLYVFGKHVTLTPYPTELLANLIYGPSAVSLTYALALHGMIPESVRTISSITNKRNKRFETPLGLFTYQYIHPDKYSVGIQSIKLSESNTFLIANKERALCDLLYTLRPTIEFSNKTELETFLLDDLRCDEDIVRTLSLEKLKSLEEVFKHKTVTTFVEQYNKW